MTGEYFHGGCVQALLLWVGLHGGPVDGSATAGTQGCAASPGGGPGKEFRGASQSCGGQLKPPCDLQDPGGPARPGASRGRGCHRCVTAQPHTHTDTHHTDVRTHGHAQSREGAPTGPGGRGRDAVQADRRAYTDVRTHGHAQSREGAPTGPGGRGRDAVPADRRGVRRGHGGLSPVRCTGPQQLRFFTTCTSSKQLGA